MIMGVILIMKITLEKKLQVNKSINSLTWRNYKTMTLSTLIWAKKLIKTSPSKIIPKLKSLSSKIKKSSLIQGHIRSLAGHRTPKITFRNFSHQTEMKQVHPIFRIPKTPNTNTICTTTCMIKVRKSSISQTHFPAEILSCQKMSHQ